LTAALHDNGHLPTTAIVKSLTAESIGQGRGFAGSIRKLTVGYAGDSEAPSTIVAKSPSADLEIRNYAIRDGMYRRETMFYRELATESGIRVPDCFFADLDPDSGDFVLLLEDLTALEEGDEIAGCSLEQAVLVVRSIARLHARWWNDRRVAGLDWLGGDPDNSTGTNTLQKLYQDAWSRSTDTLAHIYPSELFVIAEQFGHGLTSVLQAAATGNQTLNHGDCHLGNLFFGDDQAVFTDWQNVMVTSPALDIAYFVQGSLPVETRRAHERELLDIYLSTLREIGVTDYSIDQLIEDYRRGLLRTLIPSVLSMANLDMETPESRELVRTIGARMIGIVDWDCGDLISH
jgi:hypothetical protein